MKGDIKEFREKGKPFRGTHEYCGKLTLIAEHPLDATLLALGRCFGLTMFRSSMSWTR
jgi:hypothetical protein